MSNGTISDGSRVAKDIRPGKRAELKSRTKHRFIPSNASEQLYLSVGYDSKTQSHRTKRTLPTILNSISFASQIHIFLAEPITSGISQDSFSFQWTPFYHVHTTLGTLLKEPCYTLLRQAKVNVLTSKTRIDMDDVVAFTKGHLILNVTKNTYQQLGLTGSPCHVQPGRFVFKADLSQPCWNTDTKKYTHLLERIASFFKSPVSFWLSFQDMKEEETASIVQALSAKPCSPLISRSFHTFFDLPDVDAIPFESLETQSDMEKVESGLTKQALFLHEWLGLVSCIPDNETIQSTQISTRISKGDKVDPFIASYTRECSMRTGNLLSIKIQGFFTANTLDLLFQQLLAVQSQARWVAVSIHGFRDSPVSWRLEEHGFGTNGENETTVVLKGKDESCLFYQCRGAFDSFSV